MCPDPEKLIVTTCPNFSIIFQSNDGINSAITLNKPLAIMENASKNLNNDCGSNDASKTDRDSQLLTSNPDVITSVVVTLAVTSTFTVVANCIIIAAILRAYIYGISNSTSPATSLRFKVSTLFKRHHPYKLNHKKQPADDGNLISTRSVTSRTRSPPRAAPISVSIEYQPQDSPILATDVKTLDTGVGNSSTTSLSTCHATWSSVKDFKTSSATAALPAEDIGYGVKPLVKLSSCSKSHVADLMSLTEMAPITSAVTSLTSVLSEEPPHGARLPTTSSMTDAGQARAAASSTTGAYIAAHSCEKSQAELSRTVPCPRPYSKTIRLANDSGTIPIVLMFSMAISDALLGAVIMPLSTLEIVNNGLWPFGSFCCKLRMALDIFLSTTSIYHVTCMAADRYIAVCRPFFHRKLSVRTGVKAAALCWLLPLIMVSCFHIPNASTSEVVQGSGEIGLVSVQNNTAWDISTIIGKFKPNNTHNDIYLCEQTNSVPLQIISAAIAFYIPFIFIIVLSFLVYVEIRKVSKRQIRLRGTTKSQPKKEKAPRTFTDFLNQKFLGSLLRRDVLTPRAPVLNQNKEEEFPGKIPGSESCQCVFTSLPNCTSHPTDALHVGKPLSDLNRLNTKESPGAKTNVQCRELSICHLSKETCIATSIDQELGEICVENCEHESPMSSGLCGSNGIITNDSSKPRPRTTSRKKISSENDRGQIGSDVSETRQPDKKTSKAVMTIGSVVLVFTICWLPFSILIVVMNLIEVDMAYWLVVVITWLGYINSSLNPVLYCGHHTIRAAIGNLVRSKPLQEETRLLNKKTVIC